MKNRELDAEIGWVILQKIMMLFQFTLITGTFQINHLFLLLIIMNYYYLTTNFFTVKSSKIKKIRNKIRIFFRSIFREIYLVNYK